MDTPPACPHAKRNAMHLHTHLYIRPTVLCVLRVGQGQLDACCAGEWRQLCRALGHAALSR
eukprot:357381-Chlamydomonas_euryale.AAC.19